MNSKIDYRFLDKTFQASTGLYFPKGEVTEAHVQQNRIAVENEVGAKLALLKQIHSPTAVYHDAVLEALHEADAHVTNLPGVALGIVTADCVPVLFYSSCGSVIGAAHCGWRSARHGVVASTIKLMKDLGASDISAIIGPAIQQDSYEVSEEFYDEFLSEADVNVKFFIESDENEGKFYFDLPSYVEMKVSQEGGRCIFKSSEDTYSNHDKYHSRRRSFHKGEDYQGNLLSVIMIKPC